MSEAMSDAPDQQEPTMEEILASIRRIISEDEETPGDDATSESAVTEAVVEEAPSDEPEAPDPQLPDNEAVAAEAPEPEPAVAAPELVSPPDDDADDGDGDDVLELTKMVTPDGGVVDLETAAPANEEEPAIEEEEIALDDGAPRAPFPLAHEGLVSSVTAAATTDAFAGMSGLIAQTRGLPLGQNQTLEGIVKELLRPVLKEWLDQNLAQLVQRIVEREVNKLAGQAESDDHKT